MGILKPAAGSDRRSTSTAELEEAARQEEAGLHRQLVRLFRDAPRVYFATDPKAGYQPVVVERKGRRWVDAYLHEHQMVEMPGAEYGELPERSWCSGRELAHLVHEQYGPEVGITLVAPYGARLPVVEPVIAAAAPVPADTDGSAGSEVSA
ncbi:hypothetical protein [Longimycelium tulufanense]|uniref:hypothetical protein n=1 Tax=Longimycelium tulufanense TaxID=907463 RepID=UPI0016650A72|nr:hypothetical protein [Longimycelium tulufanense]